MFLRTPAKPCALQQRVGTIKKAWSLKARLCKDFFVQSFNLLPRQAFIITQNNSKEAAGDAIFNAIFEAAPSLQTMLLGWLLD